MLTKIRGGGLFLTLNGVKYSHHPNGGGLVAETAKVAPGAFIGRYVVVHDRAEIGGRAKLFGDIVIRDNTRITGYVYMCGDIEVKGNTVISGKSRIIGKGVKVINAKLRNHIADYGNEVISDSSLP